MNLFGISSKFTVSTIRIAERSFRNLSGVEKFMFDKTRSNNLLGKTKERKIGQRKIKKGKVILDRAFLKVLSRVTILTL